MANDEQVDFYSADIQNLALILDDLDKFDKFWKTKQLAMNINTTIDDDTDDASTSTQGAFISGIEETASKSGNQFSTSYEYTSEPDNLRKDEAYVTEYIWISQPVSGIRLFL